jgi:hypothetical protein
MCLKCCRTSTYHMTASCLQFHWLPDHYRITYKLYNYVQHSSRSVFSLRGGDFHVSCTPLNANWRTIVKHLYICTRFQDCGRNLVSEHSATWNSLPEHIHCGKNVSSFKKDVKTHFSISHPTLLNCFHCNAPMFIFL